MESGLNGSGDEPANIPSSSLATIAETLTMDLRPSTAARTQRAHTGNGKTTKRLTAVSTPRTPNPPSSPEPAPYVRIWVRADQLIERPEEVLPIRHSSGIEIGELMLRLLMLEREFLAYAERVPDDRRFYLGKAKGIADAMHLIQAWKDRG